MDHTTLYFLIPRRFCRFFNKHLASHKHELWPPEEVSREDGERDCPLSGCKTKLKGWKNVIQHLATVHEELKTKLRDNGESLSDYELPLEFEDEDPETQIARTIKAARTDPEDIFQNLKTLKEKKSSQDYLKVEDVTVKLTEVKRSTDLLRKYASGETSWQEEGQEDEAGALPALFFRMKLVDTF